MNLVFTLTQLLLFHTTIDLIIQITINYTVITGYDNEQNLNMASFNTMDSVELLVEKTQNLQAKEFGGENETLADLSTPEKFLNWQFPDWKYNNETVMVPPAFTPSQLGLTVSTDGKYLHEGDVNVPGIIGERLVYDHLQQLGKANRLGMFVIHEFKLQDIISWNERCRKEDQVPPVPIRTGESDFFVFHHKKGVILMEVKNLKEAQTSSVPVKSEKKELPKTEVDESEMTKKKLNKEIAKAKEQLDRSREIIKCFSKTDPGCKEASDLEPFPVIMAIVLPSTKKGTIHTCPDDTLFIYEEDFSSPESFSQWWSENINEAPSMATTAQTTLAYELALSRMLAVRHLGPVSESEYTANASYTLETFKHLENLARHFPRIKEEEHPHLFQWCKEMFQVVESSSELPTSKAMKGELFSTLKSLNITAAEANLLKKLNESLSLSGKKFLCGDEPGVEDLKVFQYLSQKYVMDIDSIVNYMNRVTEAIWKELEIPVITDRTLKDLCLEETDNVSSLNELSKLLARYRNEFLIGECCTNLDVELCCNLAKGDIRVLLRPCAPIFTVEQLAVFEGPKKQLIIGGPGSGKTELMRSKALMLSHQSKGKQRILYLIQLPGKDKTVFPNTMKQYFNVNKARNVDVKTIELEGEHGEAFKQQRSEIELQTYSHVFIDELWIGSKIRFQMQKGSDTITTVDELAIVKEQLRTLRAMYG